MAQQIEQQSAQRENGYVLPEDDGSPCAEQFVEDQFRHVDVKNRRQTADNRTKEEPQVIWQGAFAEVAQGLPDIRHLQGLLFLLRLTGGNSLPGSRKVPRTRLFVR